MTEPKPVVLPLHHSTILIEAFNVVVSPKGKPLCRMRVQSYGFILDFPKSFEEKCVKVPILFVFYKKITYLCIS